MNKLVVQFSNTFWDSSIKSFSYTCEKQRGRFRFTICIPSPANILILFVTGDFARELESLTDKQILDQIMEFLRQIFPNAPLSDLMKDLAFFITSITTVIIRQFLRLAANDFAIFSSSGREFYGFFTSL